MDNEAKCLVPDTEVVKTKRGDITVRELAIEDIGIISNELLTLFTAIPEADLKEKSNIFIITRMLGKGDLVNAIKRIAAQVTDKDVTFYDKFPVLAMGKIIMAFLRVNPPKELRDLFFALKTKVLEGTL